MSSSSTDHGGLSAQPALCFHQLKIEKNVPPYQVMSQEGLALCAKHRTKVADRLFFNKDLIDRSHDMLQSDKIINECKGSTVDQT